MNRLHHLCILLAAFLLLGSQLPLQAQSDSTAMHCQQQEQFNPRQLILPASLIAVGTFGVHNGWFHQVRDDVRSQFTDWRSKKCHVDDYVQYLPVVSNIGLGLAGVKGRHSMRERVAVTATAYLIMGVVNQGMKHTIREKRPDSNTRNSFPSGHTGTAFMGAELVRCEYGTGYGIAAYALATGVAFMRLYNDRHWLNDVIGGAGVGILSVQAAYWLLPLERRLLKWDQKDSQLTFIPTYDGRSAQLSLALTF